jgi:hypothetical protein
MRTLLIGGHCLCFCCSTLCFYFLFSGESALGSSANHDSTKTANWQYVNKAFSQIYRENLVPAFYGNEYGEPDNNLLVADITPNVVILNTAKSRFFFVITPRIQLRLLQGYHSPVKSPSYMPGGSLFTRLNNDYNHPAFLSLNYSHHSNGQEGPTLDSAGHFNHDGKFTTNFYSLNFFFGNRHMREKTGSSRYVMIGLEVHTGLFNIGYSRQLTNKYGFIRTNGMWMYDSMKDRSGSHDHYLIHQRIRFDMMYIWDKTYNYAVTDWRKRMNISAKYYYQFGFMENVALILEVGYRGQDSYNNYFENSFPFFGLGVASGVSLDTHKSHHNQDLGVPTD